MSITIAIPFYNAENYLLDSIKSVFAQTHHDWELILIDDGSTDSSLEIAYSIVDPRVRVISDGKNKRLAARLNEIARMAKYDYIARMDADDLMDPERLEIQMNILINNPTVHIVTSGVYSVLNDLTLLGARGTQYDSVSFEELISRRKGITHAAILARKEWHLRNPYDETWAIAQDLELWIRSSYNKDLNAIAIPDPLYIYREENNVTVDKLLRAYANERTLLKKYKGVTNKLYLKSLIKSLIVRILGALNQEKMLQANRNTLLTEDQKQKYQKILTSINAINLPLKNEA